MLQRGHAVLALMVLSLLAVEGRGLFCAVDCLGSSTHSSAVSREQAAHCGGAAPSGPAALQVTDGPCAGHAEPGVASHAPVRSYQLAPALQPMPRLTACTLDVQRLDRPAASTPDDSGPPGALTPLRI